MDILKIIQTSGLRFDYVAQRLFPNNKHPYNALNRLINKKSELSESQIKTLADLSKRSTDDLLGLLEWSGKFAGLSISLRRGDYMVAYRPGETSFELFYFVNPKDAFVSKGKFEVPKDLTVRQFLACVEDEIENLS